MQEMLKEDDYSSRNLSHFSQGQTNSSRPQQTALVLADDSSYEHGYFIETAARVSLSDSVSIEMQTAHFSVLTPDNLDSYGLNALIRKTFQQSKFRGMVVHVLKSIEQGLIEQKQKDLLLKCIVECVVGSYKHRLPFIPYWAYRNLARVQPESPAKVLPVKPALPETLDLSHANLEEAVVENLTSMLALKGSQLSHLRTLNLAHNNLRHGTFGRLKRSSAMHLATLFSQGHWHLTTLNLSGNTGLGGSTKRWGSGLYHIIIAIKKAKNNTLESFMVSDTGLTDIDVTAIAEMLEPHPTMKVVDLSDNQAITDLSKVALGKCSKTRFEHTLPPLFLDLSRTKLAAFSLDEQDQHSIQAFRTALHLQVDRLNLRALGNQMFELYHEKKYPPKWEYYVKIASTVLFMVGGTIGLACSGVGLITSVLTAAGVLVASAAGIGINIGSILSHFITLFKTLSEHDIKLMEELLSMENLEHCIEVIKKTGKLAHGSYERIKKCENLRVTLSSSEAKKRKIDKLCAQLERVAELFVGNDQLCGTIVAGISHHYHEVISRLSAGDAKKLAKGLEKYLRIFLFAVETTDRDNHHLILEEFLKCLQFTDLKSYEVVRVNGGKFKGYVILKDKSFFDIFQMERAKALQLIKDREVKEKFKDISVSSESLLGDSYHSHSDRTMTVTDNTRETAEFYFDLDSGKIIFLDEEDKSDGVFFYDGSGRPFIDVFKNQSDDPTKAVRYRVFTLRRGSENRVDLKDFIERLKGFDWRQHFSLVELLDQQSIELSALNTAKKKDKVPSMDLVPGFDLECLNLLRSEFREGTLIPRTDRSIEESQLLIKRLMAHLFFMTQESHYDLTRAHPAFLQALARLEGITLTLWERGQDGRLIPYHELSCAQYVPPENSTRRMDLLMEDDHNFSQITFIGYPNKTPTEADGPILPLSAQQEQEAKANQVWLAYLVQRSGFKCQNGANQTIRFNISTKVVDKEEWITTEHETYGCRQLSKSLLDIIQPMVAAYRDAVEKNEMTSACGNYKLSRETLQILVEAGELSVVPLDFITLCEEVAKVKEDVKKLQVQAINHEQRIGDLEMNNAQAKNSVVEVEKIVQLEQKLGHSESQIKEAKKEAKDANDKIEILESKLGQATGQIAVLKDELLNATNNAQKALKNIDKLALQLTEMEARVNNLPQGLANHQNPANHGHAAQNNQRADELRQDQQEAPIGSDEATEEQKNSPDDKNNRQSKPH